ncbi:hypothetical protein BDV36DRAFT_257731 [Aspergillus pseudocaelatus]|uniref:Uncharacterized protein n=1 Tax=Aspergillus pseudocaelatus TaxID=1825620 RepID=A0ABQ6WJ94_9EURO|nr:hypothetical protein BDV36DRAFT_257731 [Aspergillus pseudocaelatus]
MGCISLKFCKACSTIVRLWNCAIYLSCIFIYPAYLKTYFALYLLLGNCDTI